MGNGNLKPASNLTAIVLAGGKSTRLGVDKALERLDGQTVIERVLARLSLLVADTVIVISQRQAETSYLRDSGTKVVVDLYPDRAALGGVYTGLAASSSQYNFAVACDMPFLNTDLIRYMASLAPDYDAVIPRVDKYIEPLHSIYSRNCLPAMKAVLDGGRLRFVDVFERLKVRYVERDEIDRFDPEHLSFFNINTQADLELARTIVAMEAAPQ